MLAERKLALFLFVSLGLNIFLGSVLGGTLLREHRQPADSASHETRVEVTPSRNPLEKSKFPFKNEQQADHTRQDRPHKRNADGRHRRPGESPNAEGPSDLLLFRQMIRIMGGPKDPRISELREARRDEVRRIRTEMHAAHQRVHEALTADKPNETDLHDALKNLRKTAFESQARAQEGILTLAKLMTPKEREKLRELRLGDTLGEGRGEKERELGPRENKRRPAASP